MVRSSPAAATSPVDDRELQQLLDSGRRHDFERGRAQIEARSAAGDGEASAALATLHAMGAGSAQSWERAFDVLRLAGEQGSEHARAQLDLLSRRDGSIDLERLLANSGAEVLSENPRVRIARNFARPAECAWLVERARDRLRPALVWDRVTGVGEQIAGRSNSAVELSISQMDVVTQVLRTRISMLTRLPVPVFEPAQLLHYAPGQQFDSHFDYLDPRQPGHTAQLARFGQRVATALLYLNDDFDGGSTDFPAARLSFRGRIGDALFFANVDRSGRPDPLTLHAGLPPTRGEKWVFSQWIRDRSPAPEQPSG